MPRKGETDTPQKEIDKAIKRHLEENTPVAQLAKELKVTRQTIYSWVENYKRKVMERMERAGQSPAELEKIAKSELVAQIKALQSENRKLREKVLAMMMKYGEI